MAAPLETSLLFAASYVAAVMSPGPNVLLVIQNAAKDRRLGLMTALGVLPVAFFYAICGLFGIGAIINQYPWLKMAMQLACGSYLLYLGIREIYGSFRQSIAVKSDVNIPSYREAFLNGFVTNITNPKSIAFFMSVFVATKATELSLPHQLAILAIVPIINFSWYGSLVYMVSSASAQSFIAKAGPWFKRVSGLVMLGFAAALLLNV